MRWPTILRLRLRSLLRWRRLDDELAEELQYHLDRQVEEFVAAGIPPPAARLAALRAMGRYEQNREECRDMRGWTHAETTVRDARFAVRQLLRSPGFTFIAVLTLALGLSASTAIFAFVDAALLKPLPYANPAGLVGVYERVAEFSRSNLSYPDYLDWKRLNTVFSSVDVYTGIDLTLKTRGGAMQAHGARVSDGFFRTLGVRPVVGRDFPPGADLPSGPRLTILSYAAWQERFGGRPDAVGRTVTLNDAPYEIIGVLPRDFHFVPVEPVQYWVTLHPEGECDLRRSCHGLYGVGRLKDGVSIAAAEANLVAIAADLEKTYPDSNRSQSASVEPLAAVIVGDVRPILLVVLAGAALLLLIAGVNVASLILVRSEYRRRELAVRRALGASSGRLLRQFLVESIVLVSAASALGLAMALVAMQLLIWLVPQEVLASLPFLQAIGLNPRVLTFAAVVGLGAIALFTLTSVSRAAAGSAQVALAEGGRSVAGTVWRRLGARLVVAELAMAVVLLVGAGLLGRSLYLLLQVDLGFHPDRLVALQIAAPFATYDTPEKALALKRRVVERVSALPGVRSVAVSSSLPIEGWGNTMWFRVIGRPWHGEHNEVPVRSVSADYFATLGARMAAGRGFTAADEPGSPTVAIINRSMAAAYFHGEDPVGKQITPLSTPPRPITVVGVVADIKEGQIDTQNRPVLYVAYDQAAFPYMALVVRTTLAEVPLVRTMETVVRQLDADVLPFGGQSMRERIDHSPAAYIHRSLAWLVGVFAVLALVLGIVGLYAVIAYSVSRRTREIGVRVALGAERRRIYRMVLAEAGWLAAVGIVLGMAAVLGVTRFIQGLLFGVHPWDVPTLMAVALVLLGASLGASVVPARRAASIDPAEALRAE